MDPAPISVGGVIIVKSLVNPLPPSVTTSSVIVLPETVIVAFSPVPVPPSSPTSKYCPFVNPLPPLVMITLSTKFP